MKANIEALITGYILLAVYYVVGAFVVSVFRADHINYIYGFAAVFLVTVVAYNMGTSAQAVASRRKKKVRHAEESP